MAPAVKTRPYRRILTSTLHRRFVHASAFALLVCYTISFIIGQKTSFFWSWFPLGSCGIRTLLIFASSLSVFILRVGQMHVGARTTVSHFQTFTTAFFSFNTVQTFGWYLFSSWWFSEVSKWSSSEEANLNWVKPGRVYERAQLNERPIYLHCFYILLAVVQSTLHLYNDWNEVPLPVTKRSLQSTDRKTHQAEPFAVKVNKALPRILYESALISCTTALVGPLIYMFLLRQIAWSSTLYFAKLFWDFPRSAVSPPGYVPPLSIPLLLRSAISGTLLVILWQASNFLFSTLLGKAPLKTGQPLTIGAKDPNGSLINGLKAKRQTVRSFALWELCLISQDFPSRRKEIFNDIDREGGAAWSQILAASATIIRGITTRIKDFENPQQGNGSPSVDPQTKNQTAVEVHTLPRLTQPPRSDDIFVASPKPGNRRRRAEAAFGSMAKSYGQAPDWTPTAQIKARTAISRASSALLSPEQRRRLSTSAQDLKRITYTSKDTRSANPVLQRIMRSPFGAPFRQPFSKRVQKILLGSPYSDLAAIVDATESLTRLLIASLEEDQFGKVQNDVPSVVKLFTETLTALQSFTGEDGLKPHWSDVCFSGKPAGQVEDVDIVISALKTGLSDLLSAFRLYLTDVGIVGRDLQLARQAAGESQS